MKQILTRQRSVEGIEAVDELVELGLDIGPAGAELRALSLPGDAGLAVLADEDRAQDAPSR